jgi:hypothetical protein
MNLLDKLGKEFVVTTELGPVKGVMVNEAIEKARGYEHNECRSRF